MVKQTVCRHLWNATQISLHCFYSYFTQSLTSFGTGVVYKKEAVSITYSVLKMFSHTGYNPSCNYLANYHKMLFICSILTDRDMSIPDEDICSCTFKCSEYVSFSAPCQWRFLQCNPVRLKTGREQLVLKSWLQNMIFQNIFMAACLHQEFSWREKKLS